MASALALVRHYQSNSGAGVKVEMRSTRRWRAIDRRREKEEEEEEEEEESSL